LLIKKAAPFEGCGTMEGWTGSDYFVAGSAGASGLGAG